MQYADSYDWAVSPSNAGTMSGTGTIGTFMASNTWSGSYTIKVRAVNNCGDGPWSPDFSGTLNHNPDDFSLVGDGAYCEGDQGAEITMDASESGVSYELFKDNITTGTVVAGTGEAISFGYFSETGLYTATGYTDNCTENMIGQVYVHMQALPGQAGTPQGDQAVCNNETSDYTTSGASNAIDYSWILDPAEAGTLTPDGDMASVEWDSAFSGDAYISVEGENSCGSGLPSESLQVAVNALPQPAVAGLDLVCNDEESEYSTTENTGSTYSWEVNGGTITAGAGTFQISVLWGNTGAGSVGVTETTEAGCNGSSDSFAVSIDDCTGIIEGSAPGIRIYPNPASEKVQISGVENAHITVYNLMGMLLMSFEKENGLKILDISSLEKGIYLVKVQQGSGILVFRLVKE